MLFSELRICSVHGNQCFCRRGRSLLVLYSMSQRCHINDHKNPFFIWQPYTMESGFPANGVNGHDIGVSELEKFEFLKHVARIAVEEGYRKPKLQEVPVVNFATPEKLLDVISLELHDQPACVEELVQLCESVCKYSVKTGHPRFFNQLFGGLDAFGLAGEILSSSLNSSMYTYEVAPVFTLMEDVVLKKMMQFVGYADGEGTMCPGGSYGNMLGMNLARYWKSPVSLKNGMCGQTCLVVFTSEASHYSVVKNARLLGIGDDNVVKIRCDNGGRMIPEELETAIKACHSEKKLPFMVNATAGTTVLGAFDPLRQISELCKKYDLWLHVDGAWGGSCLMSEIHRSLCDGIINVGFLQLNLEQSKVELFYDVPILFSFRRLDKHGFEIFTAPIKCANSITWNPHKMMMVPLQCSVFLTKEKGILKKCHAVEVPYLFQSGNNAYDRSYDRGNEVIQCGRKIDVLKLWLKWKAEGTRGMSRQIDAAFEKARYLESQIKSRKWFKLVIDKHECTNVCFWYIPPSLRDRCLICDSRVEFPREDLTGFYSSLHGVAQAVKRKMHEQGSMLITVTCIHPLPNFFRMVIANSAVMQGDLDFVLTKIEELGADL